MKKAVAIEKLLQWAFREELPKGKPVEVSAWDAIARFGALGVRVDTSGPGDGLGFVPGAPHPDAERIGEAVMAGDFEATVSVDDLHAMMGGLGDCDPLAVRALAGVKFNAQALIIRCAVLGAAMEWDIGNPEPERVVYVGERGGRPHPIVFGLVDGRLTGLRADRNGRYPIAAEPRCHLRWTNPTVGQVAEARVEYVIWRRALLTLCIRLGSALQDHEALPPFVPPEPWRTGNEPLPRVMKSHLSSVSLRTLPLKPAGPVALPPLVSDIQSASRRRRKSGAGKVATNPRAAGVSPL